MAPVSEEEDDFMVRKFELEISGTKNISSGLKAEIVMITNRHPLLMSLLSNKLAL